MSRSYRVKTATLLSEGELERLRRGIELSDGPTRPAEVRRLRDSAKHTFIEILLTEGRNRQVRRMIEAAGKASNWFAPFFPSPLRDDGYDIGDYYSGPSQLRNVGGFPQTSGFGSRPGYPGHYRNGVESYLRSTPLVSGIAKFAEQSPPRLVCLERHRHTVQGREDHFSRYGEIELGMGSDFEIFLLASVLQPPARSQLRQSCGSGEMWDVMKFWLEMGVDGFRLDAVPYLVEREGHNCENLPETHDDPEGIAAKTG